MEGCPAMGLQGNSKRSEMIFTRTPVIMRHGVFLRLKLHFDLIASDRSFNDLSCFNAYLPITNTDVMFDAIRY